MSENTNVKIAPEENVSIKIDGSKLVITIELDNVAFHLSASGKNEMVATTSGNMAVEAVPGLKLGLNCYRPPRRR